MEHRYKSLEYLETFRKYISRLQQGLDARTFYDRTNSRMCRSINQHDINKVHDERFLLYKVLLSKLLAIYV